MSFVLQNINVQESAHVNLRETLSRETDIIDYEIRNDGLAYILKEGDGVSKETILQQFEDAANLGQTAALIQDDTIGIDKFSQPQTFKAAINMAPNEILTVSITSQLNSVTGQNHTSLYRNKVIIEPQYADSGIQGILMSPNYPEPYPNNANIGWQIQLPEDDAVIQITLLEFGTEACCDYLFIYDGRSNSDPILSVASGNESNLNEPIISSGPAIYVQFRSDCVNDGKGFALSFETIVDNKPTESSTTTQSNPITITSPVGCINQDTYFNNKESVNEVMDLVDDFGYVSNPGYPIGFPPSSSSTWSITVSENQLISFEVVDLDISETDTIFVSDDRTGGKLASFTYSDNGANMMLETTGNGATITFITGKKNVGNHRGLYINYEGVPETCITEIQLNSSDIFWSSFGSPNYPDSYGNQLYCSWKLTAPENDLIRLEVDDLQLESMYDFLYVYDGTNSTVMRKYDQLSGFDGKSLEYTTTQNTAFVVFTTDKTKNESGFRIKYKLFSGSIVCSVSPITVYGTEGYVTSVNYPSSTSHPDHICQWILRVPEGQVMSITVDEFESEYFSSADFNITFFDGVSTVDNVIFTDNDVRLYSIVDFYSSQNEVLVVVGGGAIDYIKYSFRYYSVDAKPYCNSQYNHSSDHGYITSPLYPLYYPEDTHCQYLIQTPKGTFIRLHIEYYIVKANDQIRFYDGDSTDSRLLQDCDTYCSDVNATGPAMLITFDSNSGSSYNYGFKLFYYSAASQLCNSFILPVNDNEGYSISPNYPDKYYSNNFYCVYNIAVASGQTVYFYFDMFVTESEDYLSIYDGNSTTDPLIARLSGNYVGYSGHATCNTLTLVFSTDVVSNSIGFSMYYGISEDQNSPNLTAKAHAMELPGETHEYYIIQSPGYPSFYPPNTDFLWYIHFTQADMYRIIFYFHRIDIDYGSFVRLYSGFSTESSLMTLTGNDYHGYENEVIVARKATIWFHAGSTGSGKGFYVRYYGYSV